jgi:hypothetical protein
VAVDGAASAVLPPEVFPVGTMEDTPKASALVRLARGKLGHVYAASKMVRIELAKLGRKPHGCPPEVQPAWARLVATHQAVGGLFDTLHILRLKAAAETDPRGRLSEDQLDQARAAIVFTSAGLDACLRRLLRDVLPVLLAAQSPAAGAFTRYLFENRLKGELTRATKSAIVDMDPRGRLIDLYVADLTASLQDWTDLRKVRDGLGLAQEAAGINLTDPRLETLKDFFAARNEIVHELDLVDPSGRGSRGRRHRDTAAVGSQCSEVLTIVEAFLRAAGAAVKAGSQASSTAAP